MTRQPSESRFKRRITGGIGLAASLILIAACAAALLKPLRVRKAVGIFFLAVSALSPEPVSAQSGDGKILKYHDPVPPQRLDAWRIIGPGGGGTFYHPTISPFDPNLVVATSDMTDSFITDNGGKTWRQFNLRTSAQFVFDRLLPNRILAYTGGGGSFYSDDRGRTWRMFYPEPSSLQRVWYVDDEAEPYLTSTRGHVYSMTALAVDPDDSNTLYAAWDASLWMTRDFGVHWTELTRKVKAGKIFIDPSSPKGRRSLYVVSGTTTGIWDGSAYKSFQPPAYFRWLSHTAFAIGPKGTPILYAGVDFFPGDGIAPAGGVMASEDGGETWRCLALPVLQMAESGSYPELGAIAASREHPEVIYVTYRKLVPPGSRKQYFGVMKTTDSGAHWQILTKESDTGAPNLHDSWITQRFAPDWGEQPLTMFVDDHNPNLVYASDLGRIYKTTDGGANWEALYSQGTDQGYTTTGLDPNTCYGVHFDPFDPRRIFISYTDIGLFRSENGGKSWISSTTSGVPRGWVNTTYWIEFDPAIRGKLWAVMSGAHDIPRWRTLSKRGATARFKGGVAVSVDGGVSWKPSNAGLPEMAATHIVVDPKSPPEARVLYVTGFGRGVFKSTDGGKTWKPKNSGLPATEPLTWRMALDRNGVLYVVTIRRSQNGQFGNDDDGWVFRSRDGAETWEKLPLPKGLNGPVAITVDPGDPQRLYLSAWGRYTRYVPMVPEMGGVFLSTDGGQSWKNVLDSSRRIYDVTVDPQDHNVVYAAGFEASAWRSGDRGQTWARIRGVNFKFGHRIIPDPVDRSKIYLTTFGSSVWHGPAQGDPKAVEDIVDPPLATYDFPGGSLPPKGGRKK
jgi:photosystem II stability/assembly factor-like uncharacterized protein